MIENDETGAGEGVHFTTGGKEPDPWWIDDSQIVGVGVRLDILRACAVSCEAATVKHATDFLDAIYTWVLTGENIGGGRSPKLRPIDGGKNEKH